MSIVEELKRRNVFRAAIAYVIVAWLILQVGDTLAPALHLPESVNTALAFFLILGFPLAIFLAWAYELTPEGLKKEQDVDRTKSITHITGRKLDYATIAVLLLALGYFAFDKFVLDPSRDAEMVQATTEAVTKHATEKSIAVLPFVTLSDDASNEYFSDGISEELLNLLAKIPELRVIARTSSFAYKGKDVQIADMARELNVGHVLEGSVRKSGNQVRITAQLIRSTDSSHLWSETYDRTLDNIFAIQDEIAAAVVGQLRLTLLGEAIPKVTTTDPEAYALFLQAQHLGNRYTKEALEQAELLLKDGLAIDPGFAPAWRNLGGIYRAQEDFGRPMDESKELAQAAFQQALTIDPNYAPVYASLSLLARSNFDFAAADQYLQRSWQLNTDSAFPFAAAASLTRTFGRFDESIDLARKSIDLDPVRPSAYANLGYTYYYVQHFDEAAAAFRKAISLSPERPRAHFYLGRVLLAQGDLREALIEIQKEPMDYFRLAGLALVYHALGDSEASERALANLIDIQSEAAAFQIAEVYAFRGENDSAFEWLQKAYDTQDAGLAVLLGNPLFAELTYDARYHPFVEKLGLLPYWQEMRPSI
jgi:adenylate cyclase